MASSDRAARRAPPVIPPAALDLPTFVEHWRGATLTEKAGSQSHFIDLCRLLSQPAPTDDPDEREYAFEKRVAKSSGGKGWADVWRRGCFAWEYKAPGADLRKAYFQLLQYREELANPPLLVVSDFERFEVHTNFTDTQKRVYAFTLDDLLANKKTVHGFTPLQVLRRTFTEPARLSPGTSTTEVTTQAAAEFARLAELMRQRGIPPELASRFLIRLLFCLFAEDIGLFRDPESPSRGLPLIFTDLVAGTRRHPAAFGAELGHLFAAMAHGGWFGGRRIPHFNGSLFDDAAVIELTREELAILASACERDWASIEPTVFGVLFERGLDPSKRAALGTHCTSRDDIVLIVEPVVMSPLRLRWAAVQAQAAPIIAARDEARTGPRTKERRAAVTREQAKLRALLSGFMDYLSTVRILDAAAGSGNFLYVALKLLLDLGKQVSQFGAVNYLTHMYPTATPEQLYGIEIDPYAHQLASVVVWIGYLQWFHDNGFGIPEGPILRPLNTIERRDAVLTHDASGAPREPVWPVVDYIIGNPPYLGGHKMRQELGDSYVDALFHLYQGRVPASADLVCYWFEKARALIAAGSVKRAGLLATQGIRGGANRKVLQHIKQTGDIFWAQSDRDWVRDRDGANVHVSLIGFDGGAEKVRVLDSRPVRDINSDLTSSADLTTARTLTENAGICLRGNEKGGHFDISPSVAQQMLRAALNVNGRSNSDVIRPWVNGSDIVRRGRGMSIVDFGEMNEQQAALYELPYAYVREHVYPERQKNREARTKAKWWLHRRPGSEMREGVQALHRFIAITRVAKYRLFVWLPPETIADDSICAFARDDDHFFGILQSRIHELWALGQGTQLREVESGFRYTPTTTFETFPFPWPPGQEPADDPRVETIAQAARELVQKRDAWLNPANASDAELKTFTLTNLYNLRPPWLDMAHLALDRAVLDAYGWPHELGDDDILARLLALNLQRAAHDSVTGASTGSNPVTDLVTDPLPRIVPPAA